MRDNAEFGDLYAAGSSTDALRLTLVVSAMKRWVGAVSDITGAFLLATWPENLPKYGIYPPRIVRDAGAAQSEAWIVERPLYGLRESPRIWCDFRNRRLRRARVDISGLVLVLRPTVSETELWMILDEVTGMLHGLMVLYVDDIAYFSTPEVVKAVHSYVIEEWPASELEWITEAGAVRYLGVEIGREARTDDQGEACFVYTIGQAGYVRDLLRAHDMSDVASTALPAPKEWIENAENDDDVEEHDEATLRLAQRYVGELLWLGTRTRPDIMFVVSHAASYVSKKPSYVIRLGKRLMAYLAGTVEMKMTMGPLNMPKELELIAYTDASYAPFGRRSFGAAVITFLGSPIAWKSGRQSFITLSVMEAELYAATQGCTLLNSVYALLAELCPQGVCRVLAVDNTSAASMLGGGHGSQRTRHLKIRAHYVREAVEAGELVIRHTPGSEQLADLSTKMQSKLRLQQLLRLWGFVGVAFDHLQVMKLKLLTVFMMLAQCVCPSRAQEQRTKDPLPATTWDETLFLLVVVAVVAVLVWEGLRWMQRRALRCYKRWKKGRKLDVVSRLASSAARKEIAAANQARTDETSSSLRRRRTFSPTQTPEATTGTSRPMSPLSTPPIPRTPSLTRIPSLPTTPPVQRPSSSSSRRRVTPPPLPRYARHEEDAERLRVCKDTLQLMTCEDLKSALRLQGMPVSGVKTDLVERLLPSLVACDVTDKQLRYVLYLWRLKSLNYKCKLRWEDINGKYRISAWIAAWKDA